MKTTGTVPALLLLGFFAALCAYTFSLIGKTAQLTGENTFTGQCAPGSCRERSPTYGL